ncbi:hypothetical protein [Kribbia dieselivorans]|uniref:hypothetical protein n=1 Tax=Kribbia dieselivorans TaxID=331526 RepID=UPI000838A4EE|nr:hypothetical protein [Kribbia dieselivorans]
MSDTYTWTYLDANGAQITHPDLPTTAFPSQSDAEAWFAESWQDLSDLGVESVTLRRDGEVVYGPMSLSAG